MDSQLPQQAPTKSHFSISTLLLLVVLLTAGFVSFLYFQAKLEPENTPVVVNEIDNWKTYRNEEYGFEFKYPDNFTLNNDEQEDFVYIDSVQSSGNSGHGSDLTFQIDKNPNILDVRNYYDGENNYLLFDNPNLDKEIQIDGRKAYRLYPLTAITASVNVIIPLDNLFIHFVTYGDGVILDKILSTFKFTSDLQNKINEPLPYPELKWSKTRVEKASSISLNEIGNPINKISYIIFPSASGINSELTREGEYKMSGYFYTATTSSNSIQRQQFIDHYLYVSGWDFNGEYIYNTNTLQISGGIECSGDSPYFHCMSYMRKIGDKFKIIQMTFDGTLKTNDVMNIFISDEISFSDFNK